MLTSYALMRFIIENLTLFLNWKASTTRRSPVPALKAAALLLTFALISLAIPGSSQAPNPQSGENCANNIATWETSTASLNVTPCVADSTQIISGEAYYVQLANLTWKGSPNTIDLAFKFPILMSNSGLDLWQNTSHPKTVSNCTSSQQQFNNATNTSLYNITTTACNPYTNQDFYFDWVNKNSLITHVEHATGQYYALQSVSASTGQLFQARMLFAKKDVGFGNVWKWSLFGKLNSDSISTAISTSRYSELDPAVNATAFNITSQSDTNTSVADFAPFADGKFLMGAGNRSNITGFDSWGDLNYNVDPDWKAYALREGAGTCPLNISAATASLFMETTDTGASTCTIEAIRSVNVSVPKEAGIIISWLQNKSAASLNFEAGMCFVYDSVITNDTTGRCNGGNDMFFITSDNADNYLYGKGGVPTQGFGTSGQATQHFEVWLNESHVKSCVSGVCSALGAFATTNKVQNGYVVLMIFNNLGGPAAANFFNITIANATQFGQPLNYTPARFETVLMNDTAVVDKIKITNTTYKTAGAQATFFAMDNNSKNQQSITEGSFADITDFNGLKINGTFTPQNINTTSEITSFAIEWSVLVADTSAPTMTANSTNVTTINKGMVVGFNTTFSDATGVGNITLMHNKTTDSTLANITGCDGKGALIFNCTYNLSIVNNATFAIKWFVNDTLGNMNNTIPNSTYIVTDRAPTVVFEYPSNNALIFSGNVSLNASAVDLDGDEIVFTWAQNGTINKTTTVNTTINFTKGRYFFNVSASANGLFSANQTVTVDLTNNITIHHQPQYVNISSQHSTNISVAFVSPDGASDIINYSCTTTAGACSQVSNDTTGNLRNFTFNLTGTGLQAWTATITVNNTRQNTSKITASSIFPNTQLDQPAFRFPTSNAYVNSQNHSLNYTTAADSDGDAITYYIFFEAQLNKTAAGNTTMNFSDRTTTLINVSAYDGTNWSTNATLNYSVDTTPSIIENGSISPTTAVFGNPFTVYANISEANVHRVVATIAGANYTMTEASPGSNRYNVTFTSTNLVGQYVVTDFYINDTAGNDAHNVTRLVFTATDTQQSSGPGGPGLTTVITANGTIQVVLNGTFTAKPSAIERYDAYFPSGDGKKTWQFKAEANAPVKACATTNSFYCTIGGTDKTEITIKRDYQLAGLANTYEGTITLLSETGQNAYKIPVKFTAINLGATLPINVPGLHVLPTALAWKKPENNGSAQPRIWPLLLLASSSSLPLVNKAITRRKNRKKR